MVCSVTVLEIAHFYVKPGSEDAFVEAYRQGRSLLTELRGCHWVRMSRGIESPLEFVLQAEWDSVEAHEQQFRTTERFTAWRTLIGAHFAEPPRVEHFVELD